MKTRRFVLGASASLLATQALSQRTQPPQTVPFPDELGIPPLSVPPSLSGSPNIFPIPSKYFVRAFCQSNCEDKNVGRDAVIQQWQQDGSSRLQIVSVHYNGDRNNAGVWAEKIFAPISTPTWIILSYSRPDIQNAVFKVSPDKSFVLYEASFHQGEGIFRIKYSQDPSFI